MGMSDSVQLLLLFLAWLVIALGYHFSIRNYFLASFLAAVAMVIAQQAAGYLQTGTIDPIWPLSSLIGFLLSGIVALIVGLPFRIIRILQQDHPNAED